MSDSNPVIPLLVDGRTIPIRSSLDLEQGYEQIGGIHRKRMMNGALTETRHWQKFKTTLSGQRLFPAGLAGLSGNVVMDCVAPMSVVSPTPVITLSRPARPDVTPWGYAILDNDEFEETPVSLVGSVATLTSVAGASGYMVQWLPRLTVMATLPNEKFQSWQAEHSWSVTLEEV